MQGIGVQELKMPVVMPKSLWQETGRSESVDVLASFKGRGGAEYVLGCTHEEAAVDFARSFVKSYRQLPITFFQIQTKFRDELRVRAGLVRVREFTMKDAYSFHRNQADLERFYGEALLAYHRIFKRVGLRAIVDIESDSGDMQGSKAHEFMLVTPVGEDTLFLCQKCSYRSNKEVATCKRKSVNEGQADAYEK